jgi:hypothetical protein
MDTVGIHDGLKRFNKSFPKLWKKFTGCDIFGLALRMLILFPYILEAILVSLLLSPLILFGFVYRTIKHHIPVLWLILVILLNIASLADISTDLTMLIKYIIPYYFETNGGTSPKEETGELTTEENLFYVRLILTLATCLPGVIFMSVLDKIRSKDEGKKETKMFTGGGIGLLVLMVRIFLKSSILI